MSTESSDLFGKIDALLGKRAPDALLEKALDIEDFPVLTEVVDSIPDALTGGDRRLRERRVQERRSGERRQETALAAEAALAPEPPTIAGDRVRELELLAQAIEERLTALFIRQQMRTEEAVRKLVRQELGRLYPPEDPERQD